MELFGVGVAGASDADAVVGEVVVHFGNVDLGHVARRAIFCTDRARGTQVFGSFLFGGGG